MKFIFHVVGSSRNYGDMAIQESMHFELQRVTRQKLHFKIIDLKDARPIDETMVDYINDVGDMLLIGGGGMIMKGDGFLTQSGWQFNISEENLKKIKVPIVVYSIGYNHFPYRDGFENKDAMKHLKLTHEVSALFSVRDYGTQHYLKDHGIDAEFCPDPGIFCPQYAVPLPDVGPESLKLGVNLAGDRSDLRFDGDEELDFMQRFCKELLKFCESHDNVRLIPIPHTYKYDRGKLWWFNGALEQYTRDVFRSLNLLPEKQVYTPFFAGIYAQMDIVVGMRGHSNLIAFGQQVPFVALGEHQKNRFFAEMVNAPIIGNCCSNLANTMTNLIEDAAKKKQMKSHLGRFRKEFDAFNRKVGELF